MIVGGYKSCVLPGVVRTFAQDSHFDCFVRDVGGVCSLTSEVLVNLNKGVPPPAYFDWRGWFRAGLPFFRDDFEM
ncbi:hypothetical protein J6590_010638 [Homalodisca vitripennis]|nr:hypothetical protein J6590_010638 [Homalodisca vitripennis]